MIRIVWHSSDLRSVTHPNKTEKTPGFNFTRFKGTLKKKKQDAIIQ